MLGASAKSGQHSAPTPSRTGIPTCQTAKPKNKKQKTREAPPQTEKAAQRPPQTSTRTNRPHAPHAPHAPRAPRAPHAPHAPIAAKWQLVGWKDATCAPKTLQVATWVLRITSGAGGVPRRTTMQACVSSGCSDVNLCNSRKKKAEECAVESWTSRKGINVQSTGNPVMLLMAKIWLREAALGNPIGLTTVLRGSTHVDISKLPNQVLSHAAVAAPAAAAHHRPSTARPRPHRGCTRAWWPGSHANPMARKGT